jgi:hypothetical protein
MSEPVVIGNATLWLGDCRDLVDRFGAADALERHPDATPDLASKELRGHIGGAADLGRGPATR